MTDRSAPVPGAPRSGDLDLLTLAISAVASEEARPRVTQTVAPQTATTPAAPTTSVPPAATSPTTTVAP